MEVIARKTDIESLKLNLKNSKEENRKNEEKLKDLSDTNKNLLLAQNDQESVNHSLNHKLMLFENCKSDQNGNGPEIQQKKG